MSDRRVELADLETISGYVDDLHELLKEGSLTERRAFIRSFVREVRVTGNEAVLSYSMPLLPEKIAIEKEGVLPTVRYGGRYRTCIPGEVVGKGGKGQVREGLGGGPWLTVPELLFEKKQLIPALQQLLVSYSQA